MIIQFNNNTPIYMQIIDYIKGDIISGKIKCGDKIPSVREYAEIYKVNPNTVQKALSDLESLSIIYTQRTNGKYVTDDINMINRLKENVAQSIVNEYFSKMEGIGIDKHIAISYINKKEGNK